MTAIDPRLTQLWRKAWLPPKRRTVQEWAEEELYLPKSASPKSGRYSTDPTPHVREVLSAYDDPETSFITLCWAAQSAKTTTELVCKCFNIANYEGNQIFLMPSQDMAQSYSETRLQPIIESSPALKKLKPRQKDKFKKTEMHMLNGVINLIGGSSATNLASRSAGRLFTDEIDKLKKELVNEADPLSLLFERSKWFPDRKIFLTSTPTVPTGHVWTWFLKGTQEYYYIPCPKCDKHFSPKWYKHMKWDNSDALSNEEKAKTTYLECPNCKYHIQDKHKVLILDKGKWVSHNQEATKNHRSFHYNEIMSHITKWPDLVLKFLQAMDKVKVGDKSELKNFVNSSLGEPWYEEAGQTMTDDEIEALVDKKRARGVVPKEVLGLVAGVDTQDNGFYYSVRGFGKHNTSWLITEGFVETFTELENLLVMGKFGNYTISKIYMDLQGHRTDQVYRFCRKHLHRVIPCAGRGRQQLTSEYSFIGVDKVPGVTTINGLQRLAWNTTIVKDLMFAKMKIARGKPGSFNIHKDAVDEYKKSLRSEFKDEKGNYTHIKKIPNHFLDTEALCFLGARIQGIEYWGDQAIQKPRRRVERGKPTNKNKLW